MNFIRMLLLWALIGPLYIYRLLISPLLGPKCRFWPTCSDYAIQALKTHGLIQGGWLMLCRIARCHPWGGHGIDTIPERSECCPQRSPK